MAIETKPTTKPQETRWKLAKGKNLKIDGMGKVLVTNDNVNTQTIIAIISNIEKRTGRKYFGTAIIQK